MYNGEYVNAPNMMQPVNNSMPKTSEPEHKEQKSTVDAVHSKLLGNLSEELSDAKEYLDISEKVEDKFVKECLVAIAKDEYSHAEFIMEELEDNGIAIPDNDVTSYSEVKVMLGKFCTR